jgi:hypothetical protein
MAKRKLNKWTVDPPSEKKEEPKKKKSLLKTMAKSEMMLGFQKKILEELEYRKIMIEDEFLHRRKDIREEKPKLLDPKIVRVVMYTSKGTMWQDVPVVFKAVEYGDGIEVGAKERISFRVNATAIIEKVTLQFVNPLNGYIDEMVASTNMPLPIRINGGDDINFDFRVAKGYSELESMEIVTPWRGDLYKNGWKKGHEIFNEDTPKKRKRRIE